MKRIKTQYKSVELPVPLKGACVSRVERASSAHEGPLEKQAYARGYKEAEAKYTAIIEQQDAVLSQLENNLFQNLQSEFEIMRTRVVEGIPNVLFKLIRKIWGSIALDRESFKGVVDGVLKEWAPSEEKLELTIGKGDSELLGDNCIAELKEKYGDITLLVDETLQSGDCLVRSRFGIVDARVDAKVDSLEKEIAG